MQRQLRLRFVSPETLLSAVLLLLATSPADFHGLIWLAWVPLLRGSSRASSWKAAALGGAVFGALYYGLFFRWLLRMPPILLAAAIVAGTLYGAGFSTGVRLLRGLPRWASAVLVPALWILPVLVAGNPWHPFFGSVILLSGLHSPLPLPFLQLARPLGEIGLVFFILFINVLLWQAFELRERPRRAALVAGAAAVLLAGAWAWGAVRISRLAAAGRAGKPFRVACAQHDLPFSFGWRLSHKEELFQTYQAMALEATRRGADMVLFPQYQIPEDVYRHPGRWAELARKAKAYLALGTYSPVRENAPGKEAWVISLVFSPRGELIGSHKALHPSPVGRPMVPAGDRADPIAVPGLGGLAFLPCFDDVASRSTRLFGRSGVDFIAAIANDGPFIGTSQPELHLLRSRLRAVESGKSLIRCTPNGISAVIDPAGRVLDSLPGGRGLLFAQW